MAYESMLAETVYMTGHEGDRIDAYLARPLGAGPFPALVVIHHMPGWDQGSKEITRRFATQGYVAICPNLHFREGQGSPSANSASVREAGGMPDDRLLGDIQGAMTMLGFLPYCTDKIGIIGYCSGGRHAYLCACKLSGIAAAVDCYGGGVVASAGQLSERQPVAPLDMTADLGCPLLGLFGNEDRRPSRQDVDNIEAELKKLGKTYEFHRYDGAGHAFFSVDRPNYNQAAAVDGWARVFTWFEEYLR